MISRDGCGLAFQLSNRGTSKLPDAPSTQPGRGPSSLRIVVVGPCAAGTTTLTEKLRRAGLDAHACAQEHSYVPDMWRMSHPDVLIYLDVSMATIRQRREVSWGKDHLAAEKTRLAHARQNCHCYLPTDDLTAEEVYALVMQSLY